MTSQESTLSGSNQFAPKAFLIALARYEAPLSPELIAEVNEVGEALVNGELQKASQLIIIAQKDAAFYQDFELAFKELKIIHSKKENEKNKHWPKLNENTPQRQTDYYENDLARPLTDPNPQGVAKKLLGKATDLVERVYRLTF